jgi:hypothetical protein
MARDPLRYSIPIAALIGIIVASVIISDLRDGPRTSMTMAARTEVPPGRLAAVRMPRSACTDGEMLAAVSDVVPDRRAMLTDPDAFVVPRVWDELPYQTRVGLAMWISLCLRNDGDVVFRHGNTGRVLARYHPQSGYVSEE